MIKIKNTLKYDFTSGLIVFLVAIPLCLGIALTSGAPLFSGIISGIVGGIIVGFLSSSRLGVSGPANGVMVVVLAAINDLGTYDIFLVSVIIAGIIQVLFGVLKGGIIAYFIPSSVIKGMLVAIGITIFLNQIPHTIGYDKNPELEIMEFEHHGTNMIYDLYHMIDHICLGVLITTLLSLFIFILWEKFLLKKYSLFKSIPAPLVVIVLGIILNIFFKGTILEIREENLVSLPILKNFSDFYEFITFPDYSVLLKDFRVYKIGFIIALIASLETLLSVEAAEKLYPQKKNISKNRELMSQGIGNIVSGILGGFPLSQVIVRTTVNAEAGAKTKLSAIFHGIFILLSVTLIPNVLNMIPLTSLATILLVTGFKMAKPQIFKDMRRQGPYQFVPFILTIIFIIFGNLVIGIIMGLSIAAFYVLLANYRTPILDIQKIDDKIVINLPESVSFLNKGYINKLLSQIPENCKVIIDGRNSKKIDNDIVELIYEFQNKCISKNIEVGIIDVSVRMPEKYREHIINNININAK